MRIEHLDIDDQLAVECERRAPDSTWPELIEASLRFALDNADAEQTGDEHVEQHHLGDDEVV